MTERPEYNRARAERLAELLCEKTRDKPTLFNTIEVIRELVRREFSVEAEDITSNPIKFPPEAVALAEASRTLVWIHDCNFHEIMDEFESHETQRQQTLHQLDRVLGKFESLKARTREIPALGDAALLMMDLRDTLQRRGRIGGEKKMNGIAPSRLKKIGGRMEIGGQGEIERAVRKWGSLSESERIDALAAVGYTEKQAKIYGSGGWMGLPTTVQVELRNYFARMGEKGELEKRAEEMRREGPSRRQLPSDIIREGQLRIRTGEYPSRIVLRRHGKAYVTHIQVLPPDQEPFFIWGHYFQALESAQKDFDKREKD